jgi:hypothetical protein
MDLKKQMKEKQALKWGKIRVKGFWRFYITNIIYLTLAGAIARILFNLLNHKPYLDSFPLIFVFSIVGLSVGIGEWKRKEKQYLEYLNEKNSPKTE